MQDTTNERSAASDLDTIAKAVGLVVLQWGHAEQSLGLIVALLWQSFDGKKYAKKIPFMFDPKIKFIRTHIADDKRLKIHSETANELLERFENLSSLRHDLIHGAVASISPIDNSFVFAKLDIRDGFHYHREVRIEVADYPKLVRKLGELGRDANALATQIFKVAKTSGPHIK